MSAHPLRVGFFGLLAQGNLGNDGSLEAMLAFVRDRHPEADIDVLCPLPEEITRRYGLRATRLHWNRREYETARGAGAIARKIFGKLADPVRVARGSATTTSSSSRGWACSSRCPHCGRGGSPTRCSW